MGSLVFSFSSLIGGLYIANPFLNIIEPSFRPDLYSIFHVGFFIFHSFSAFIILKDIFSSFETHTDHIWGAIVAYFLLVMMFSEVYEIISLQNPGFLGDLYEPGWPNYTQCLMFSLNAISGMDQLFPGAHKLFLKLANLENILGNLYLVVILGRLLSHPLQKKEN